MKKLKKIYIEITNKCNLSCDFCAKSQRESRIMSAEEFQRIANQVVSFTDYVYLHVRGEPLSHPELWDILEICSKLGLKVNITTNGTLLHLMENVANSPGVRQVNISLHAQVNDFDEYFDRCICFAKKAAQLGKLVSLRLWNGEESKDILQRLYRMFPNYYVKNNRITLGENIFLSLDQLWEWPRLENPYISKTGICLGLRTHAAILANGDVVPCCLDSEGAAVMGNVFSESFDDIWNNSIVPHRMNMQNRKLSLQLCQRCTYRCKFE